MNIAIVGASGNVGIRLVDQALRRGHIVTAIGRDASKLALQPGLTFVTGDANKPGDLAPKLAGHDVVISSVAFRLSDPALLIDAVRTSGVKRYLVVGGAGSLWAKPGTLHFNTPHFPEFAREEATKGKVFLDALRAVEGLDWTMLSPSALFTAGERTGVFRLGGDTLLTGADGKSWISYEDFAIAMLDEIETPKHIRQRFTVGY